MTDEYKTLPIGEIFTYEGNKYKVCEDDDFCWICSRCAFNGINCDTIKHIRGNCGLSNRTDHIQVYFIQINNETMKKDCNNINIVIPTFAINDSLSDLQIDCPEGYSIDVNNSDLSKGIIKFKKKEIDYIDVCISLNSNTKLIPITYTNCEKVTAIGKLLDIADYYNSDWKPNWSKQSEHKYCILYDNNNNTYTVDYNGNYVLNNIYFKCKEDAKAVIDNPNFREILDAIFKS